VDKTKFLWYQSVNALRNSWLVSIERGADMLFRSFLRTVIWPAILALLLLVGDAARQSYSYINAHSSAKERVALYERFSLFENLPMCLADGTYQPQTRADRPAFVHNLNELFLSSDSGVAERFRALAKFMREPEYNKFATLMKSDPDVAYVLLTQPERVPELVALEDEKKNLVILKPLRTLSILMLAIQWSPLFLLFPWAFEPHVFSLPVKRWWFYLYLALTYPGSAVLAAIVIGREVWFIFRHRKSDWKERYDLPRPYSQQCEEIRAERETHRKRWTDFFSKERLDAMKHVEGDALQRLLDSLQSRNRKLAEDQREYFDRKAKLERLRSIPELNERIGREFDLLLQHPLIVAIEVMNSTLAVNIENHVLAVYTRKLTCPHGNVGPFRIEIALESMSRRVYLAHRSGRAHPVGGGANGNFCFGNAYGLISDLLREYRISEAIGLMLQAFQSP